MDLELAKHSALVVLIHGRDAARVRAVVGDIRVTGAEAAGVTGDLATDEGAGRVFAEAAAAFGGIDILVNNAGSYAAAPWFETSPQSWLGFYQADVLSAVRLIQAAVPAMRKRGFGRIINIATGMATAPQPDMADYAAAKAALINATVSLAKAVAGTGISVNAISPGLIATDGVERVLREAARTKEWSNDWNAIQQRWMREVLRSDLVPRLGKVTEVADLVAFIASPRAGYIHGANLRIDGGLVSSIN